MSTEMYLPHAAESGIAQQRFTTAEDILWFSPDEESIAGDADRDEAKGYMLSAWCASRWKRTFDLACVAPALVLISPFFGIIAAAVRLSSPGPIIFRQQRAGQHRRLFTIYKFRTMVENSEAIGPEHTAKGDPRITLVGKFLRLFKLDELPQLYNVLRGDMSLVGPRPKLPHHDQTAMACRPGLTGAASLAFRREQHILCEVPAHRLETFYQELVVPCKIMLDADYMSRATLATDLSVLFATILRGGKCLTHKDLLLSPSRLAETKASQASLVYHSN